MASIGRVLLSVMTTSQIACLVASSCRADDILWPQHPTRIDRTKQNYERLPALEREIDDRTWVIVPARITMLDSASFSFAGKAYRIAEVHPVSLKRICKDIDGGRWTCGRAAAIFLGNLVRSKRMLCDVVAGGKVTILRRCQTGRRDIAAEIVGSGFGRTEGGGPISTTEQLARKKRSGLWRNPDCLLDFDRC